MCNSNDVQTSSTFLWQLPSLVKINFFLRRVRVSWESRQRREQYTAKFLRAISGVTDLAISLMLLRSRRIGAWITCAAVPCKQRHIIVNGATKFNLVAVTFTYGTITTPINHPFTIYFWGPHSPRAHHGWLAQTIRTHTHWDTPNLVVINYRNCEEPHTQHIECECSI